MADNGDTVRIPKGAAGLWRAAIGIVGAAVTLYAAFRVLEHRVEGEVKRNDVQDRRIEEISAARQHDREILVEIRSDVKHLRGELERVVRTGRAGNER
jgi:beta-lactamase regulating signal transducer with metallopeptidase domain